MRLNHPTRWKLVVVTLIVFAAATTGGYHTASAFVDSESTSSSIQAAGDVGSEQATGGPDPGDTNDRNGTSRGNRTTATTNGTAELSTPDPEPNRTATNGTKTNATSPADTAVTPTSSNGTTAGETNVNIQSGGKAADATPPNSTQTTSDGTQTTSDGGHGNTTAERNSSRNETASP